MDKNRYCVIMAGGQGTRLWPMSRKAYPKQFQDILGCGRTLLQITYDRYCRIVPKENILVSTHVDYADLVKEQLPDLQRGQVIHDTGSAVEGIPMEGNHPYISSGTWSLLGVKTPKPITDSGSEAANYSNEGGVGYNRYQKNIMGMWLVNELQRELCPEMKFPEIVKLAEESVCRSIVDANASEFLAPKSMKAAFDSATRKGLSTTGDYFRCAYRSLAISYKQAIAELEANTGCRYKKLYIVGGGAKNASYNGTPYWLLIPQ